MYKTKIIDFLKLLNPLQIEELDLFIGSEYHNRGSMRTDTIALFQVLKLYYPDFLHDDLDRERVYKTLFPDKKPLKGKLEKTISELHRLTKEFLLVQSYQNSEDQFQKSMDWARILKDLKGADNYAFQIEKIEKTFFNNTNLSAEYYYKKFRFEYEKFDWLTFSYNAKEDVNLPNTFTSLFDFFEVYRLELTNFLLLQRKLTNFEISSQLLKSFDYEFEFVDAKNNVIYDINRRINHLLRVNTPEVVQFYELLDLLQKNEQVLSSDILRDYYVYLRNICTILVNGGDEQMNTVLHQIQRDNIRLGYLYLNEKLPVLTLVNITRTAIRAGNIEWASEFIEDHKDRLIDNIDSPDYYLVNKALCLFALGKYEETLDLLPQHSPNVIYHLIARRTEIMCYYELGSDLLNYKVDAFKIYIWRASSKFLSESVQEANKAFVNLLFQLMSTTKGDKSRLELLNKRLESKEEVVELTWLRAKIKEKI
jgi:hypothetical protein